MPPHLRVGVDIGGTFTDFALLDETTGRVTALKIPSDRARPAASVFAGLREFLDGSGARAEDIAYFSHGTTLAVNTILEYNGARTALLVTNGLRDILHIGRHRLPDIFNFFTDMPRPLVRRAHVVEIAERCLADGTVAATVTRAMIEDAVVRLREIGAEAVAVGFLHSYRNPANERATKRLLEELAPDLYVSLSSEVWPQMREFERTLAGVMNAYVGRRMERYFGDLEAGLRDEFRLAAPVLSTKSNGGVMTAAEAARRPTETLMSGPAAGAMGAAFLGRAAGFDRLITLDIGGTSTDVSVIDGEPRYSTDNHVGNFPVIMPAVDVTSIGAGGGSIAWADSFGVIKVGPQSAGARPGPACYGLGGERPTLTDAFVCLGIVDAGEIAGGRVRIDRALADRAIDGLAAKAGMGREETAEAVIRIATSHIYATLVPLLARKGVDYSEYTLLPFGGAGPMHGLLVAREVGIRRVIVPPQPGVLCAMGALVADVRRDFVRTFHESFEKGHGGGLAARMDAAAADLRREGAGWLDSQGLAYIARRFRPSADLRYEGQSFEIEVSLDDVPLDAGDGPLISAFEREYEKLYGYAGVGGRIEVRELRMAAVGETAKPRLERRDNAPEMAPLAVRTKQIFHDGAWRDAAFLDRDDLPSGVEVRGPAVIRQYDTTTFVPSGYVVAVDVHGNLIGEALR
ncbi:hydantoinase/oxoprolinase family protein [Elioraea sp.]|uniref:hydantoinase/oxoprolinase family protein n=1 Tax=Elioraea sp. TaxID=2185103 RepID=UPI0025B9DFAC|nr:hydantoinase/oxoprolinase family protein [Elioraea sp.]